MNRCKTLVIAASLLALSACESGDAPPQEFTVTLTEVGAVKQGSNEALPVPGTPVAGATLTLTVGAP